MEILELLAEKESAIVKKWTDKVLGAFPEGAVRFLKKRGDRFANPLGHNLTEGLEVLFRAIRSEDPQDVTGTIEQLMKIRAVQAESTPSESLTFMFEVRRIIRDECRKEWSTEIEKQWEDISRRIDLMTLQAFDFYMAGRERLYQVRIREVERGNHLLTDNMKCPSAMLREDRESKKAEND